MKIMKPNLGHNIRIDFALDEFASKRCIAVIGAPVQRGPALDGGWRGEGKRERKCETR